MRTSQHMYDTHTRRCSIAAVGCGAATRGQEEVGPAAWVSRRRVRLEDRKKMIVDGEQEEEHAQGLGDRRV
jgi:hypothetical protein